MPTVSLCLYEFSIYESQTETGWKAARLLGGVLKGIESLIVGDRRVLRIQEDLGGIFCK